VIFSSLTVVVAKLQWETSETGGDVHYIVIGWHNEMRVIDSVWLRLLKHVGRGSQARAEMK